MFKFACWRYQFLKNTKYHPYYNSSHIKHAYYNSNQKKYHTMDLSEIQAVKQALRDVRERITKISNKLNLPKEVFLFVVNVTN